MCEAHYLAGGAAQSFDIKGYQFDAGPSFFAGLSGEDRRSLLESLLTASLQDNNTWELLESADTCSWLPGPIGAKSTNPLKQVLNAIEENVECVTYDQVNFSWQAMPHFQQLCGPKSPSCIMHRNKATKSSNLFSAVSPLGLSSCQNSQRLHLQACSSVCSRLL